MNEIVMSLANLIENNGKTRYENKLDIPHTIPLGSLVEINENNYDNIGLCLYLVMHVRDANGHPLNYLSNTLDDMNENTRNYARMTIGYRDEDLTLISSS